MNRPLSELEVRSNFVLQLSGKLREKFIEIAATKSPSATFDLASRLASINGISALAAGKATRWLAVVRRDHGQEIFNQIITK